MESVKERRSRLVGDGDIDVAFEFFSPKTEKMEEALWGAIRRLEPLRPADWSLVRPVKAGGQGSHRHQ